MDLPGQTGTCRRPAAMRAGASSIAITRAGATVRDEDKYAACCAFGQALPRIRAARGGRPWTARVCRARRCWRPSCDCSRRRSSASATRNTPANNRSFGLTTLRDRHVEVEGATHSIRVPRQERQVHIDRAQRPPAGAHRQGAAAICPDRSCFSISTRTADRRSRSIRPT